MGCAWVYLPWIVTSLPPQSGAALRRALLLAVGFMGGCVVISVVLAGILSATQWRQVPRTVELWTAVLVEGNAATPALGATLFVLAAELGTARERALHLVQRARDQALERQEYEQLRDELARRSTLWARVLVPTACIGAFNTLASIYFMHAVNQLLAAKPADRGDATAQAVWHLLLFSQPVLPAFLVEEIALVVVLLVLVASINDAADAIGAALVQAPWGAYGSTAEGQRLDLIGLTTVSAVSPESARGSSCCSWSSHAPATFTLAGVRVTRGFVVGAVVSFAASVLLEYLFDWLRLP